MAVNPTIYIDGDKRRIYEVPDLSSFVVDGGGYRIYTPDSLVGRVDEFVNTDFQPDIWSDFQDWHKLNEWSTIAINRSGGASRGLVGVVEQFASNDYQIRTSIGWKIVPADYPHVWQIFGNVLADQQDVTIFDAARITSAGVSANVRMADSLQVIFVTSGSGLSTLQDDRLRKLWKMQGLDPVNPVTVTPTARTTPDNDIDQVITGDGETTSTVTAQ